MPIARSSRWFRVVLVVLASALILMLVSTQSASGAGDECPAVRSERKVLSPRPGDPFFGRAIAALGDVDGDGTSDLAVGFHGDATRGAWEGSVVVLSGATRTPLCTAVDTSAAGGAQLGSQVAALGDVDGDGTTDFASSAPTSDRAAYDGGAVLVFSGDFALGCPLILSWTHPSAATYDHLGQENGLARGPDLDGDGIAEILAGAPDADLTGAAEAGKAFVFDPVDGTLLRTLVDPSPQASDRLGIALAAIDDVTGDGIPDIAAGAPRRDGALYDQGAVVIFSGADGSFVTRLFDPAGTANAWFGWSLAPTADLDGDGVADLIVGAIYEEADALDAGQVIALSPIDGRVLWRARRAGGDVRDYLGWSTRAAGDLDRDGTPDVVAGAPYATAGVANAGVVLAIAGADGSVLRELTPLDVAAEDLVGFAADASSDLTGDGTIDYVLSASHDDLPKYGADRGSIVVVAFEDDCDGDGIGVWAGDCDDYQAGVAPGALESCNVRDDDCDGSIDEDEDGDGFDACGEAPCASDGSTNLDPTIHPGAPELCDGKDNDCDTAIDEGPDADGDTFMAPCDCDDGDGSVHPGATEVCNHRADGCAGVDSGFTPVIERAVIDDRDPRALDQFGHALASIGDVDGDAVPDFVIGAPGDDSPGWEEGQVTLVSGAVQRVLCRTSATFARNIGGAVVGTGDIDGDGVPDFAAGAPGHDTVLLFSGTDCSLLGRCDDPYAANNGLGDEHGLASWVDMDGDGVREILAGGLNSNIVVHHGGIAFAFRYERATGTCSVLFEFRDPDLRIYDGLGASLAGVGDLTGDGVPDVVVGEPGDDSLAENNGAVLLFSGADGSFVRRYVDSGAHARDNAAQTVAGAPDLDGDGWPEVLASAIYGDNAAGADAGHVIVFSGRDGTVLRRLYDAQGATGERLSSSFALVGDHDGDGLPDVLAGAPYADPGGVTNAGRAVLLSSGTSPTHLGAFTAETPATSTYFGFAVASAGDLSGDGLDEFLVGTPSVDGTAGADVGRAWIFARESDCDDDGSGPWHGDCDDTTASLWRVPTEVREVLFHADERTLSWDAPLDPGEENPTLFYDVLVSENPGDFMAQGTCAITDTTALHADIPAIPDPGLARCYLVRAANGCGEGDLGTWGPEDWPRDGCACP